jgi:hypothetical protein
MYLRVYDDDDDESQNPHRYTRKNEREGRRRRK